MAQNFYHSLHRALTSPRLLLVSPIGSFSAGQIVDQDRAIFCGYCAEQQSISLIWKVLRKQWQSVCTIKQERQLLAESVYHQTKKSTGGRAYIPSNKKDNRQQSIYNIKQKIQLQNRTALYFVGSVLNSRADPFFGWKVLRKLNIDIFSYFHFSKLIHYFNSQYSSPQQKNK